MSFANVAVNGFIATYEKIVNKKNLTICKEATTLSDGRQYALWTDDIRKRYKDNWIKFTSNNINPLLFAGAAFFIAVIAGIIGFKALCLCFLATSYISFQEFRFRQMPYFEKFAIQACLQRIAFLETLPQPQRA